MAQETVLTIINKIIFYLFLRVITYLDGVIFVSLDPMVSMTRLPRTQRPMQMPPAPYNKRYQGYFDLSPLGFPSKKIIHRAINGPMALL